MLTRYIPATVVGVAVLAFTLAACSEKASHVSHYAGQETRQITSLSADDVKELAQGGGWGLAKAAELNGMPGPAHLLELKDEIGLSAAQVAEITTIHDAMRAEAKTLGTKLIDLERALDAGFKSQSFTAETLQTALADLGSVRTQLRFSHLSAHLRTPSILTDEQITRYNDLRGYGKSGDPCANPPKGHDLAMWRKHNGCE